MEWNESRQQERTAERRHLVDQKAAGRLLQIYDGLTGAMKMHAFREQGERIARRNPERKYAVVYFNILDFKSFNERYSFDRGNSLIIALSDIIRDYFPKALVGRYFGDQFVVFCSREEVYPAVGRIHDEFSEIQLNMKLELKSGIYVLPSEDFDINTACDRAKTAAESIRRQRWLSYRYYDEELNQQLLRKRAIVENIYTAISEEQIEAYYQPVIRTLSGETCGLEALVRWRDPEFGLLSPAEFVPVLEEYQLIHKLDLHVVELVCRQLSALRQAGEQTVPVSFNLSRLDFQLCDIFDEIETLARFYRVPREMLHVELTESILAGDPQKIKADIRRFHDAGYQIWMDDFGSGYSSLNVLKDYDVDLLKIDMLFLRDFSEKSKKIIASIVDMAKKVGVRTLAEGVETKEQLMFLREIGCEKGQGYYIGRPQPYQETMEQLRARTFRLEQREHSRYADDLGYVNLLSADELYPSRVPQCMGKQNYEATTPIAIIELCDDRISAVFCNHAFEETLCAIDQMRKRQIMEALNEPNAELYHESRSYLKVLRAKRQVESIDVMIRGNLCSIRGKYLSETADRQAFLVSIYNFSDGRLSDRKLRMAETMQSIYEMYELAGVIFPVRNRCFCIYQSQEYVRDMHSHSTLEMREYFGKKYIHPADLEQYWAFLEPGTMESRLQLSEEGVLDCFLRAGQPGGRYRWMQFCLKPIVKAAGFQLLLTVKCVTNRVIIGLLEKNRENGNDC